VDEADRAGGAMSLVLFRIDDRLIHGQVVVGWGQRLGVAFIVLVDDAVRANVWEQELYRMGVPPAMDVIFASVAEATAHLAEWERDPRPGILLTGDVDTMVAVCEACTAGRAGPGARGAAATPPGEGKAAPAAARPRVNVGGVHAREGRIERLHYVFLSEEEAAKLRALAERGVEVTAQDLPSAKPVPIGALL
jgi:D-glucosaminate PTS system EIIB component